MTLTLRTATRADAERLSSLAQLVWLYTYAANGIDAERSRYTHGYLGTDHFAAWCGQRKRHLILAEDAERLLGYAQLSCESISPLAVGNRCELETLYVHPRLTRQGIGQALLDAARLEARTRGFSDGLWLSAWSENHPALDFYRAQGLRVLGETVFRLGDQDYPNLLLADGL